MQDNSILNVNRFGVLVGSTNLSTTSLTDLRLVNQIVVHPNYNSNSNDSDIALIRLTQPLNFILNSIQPILLNQSEILPGKDALISAGVLLTTSHRGNFPRVIRINYKEAL